MSTRASLQPHLHLRSLAGGGADLERAAEGLDAFAHLPQTEVPLLRQARQGRGIEAQAVIAHPQEEAGRQVECHPDAACLSVTGDVVQRLLHDAEEDRLQRRRQTLALPLHLQRGLQAVLLAEFAQEMLQGWPETLLVQRHRTQGKDGAAHFADFLAQDAMQLLQFRFGLGRVALDQCLPATHLEAQRGQVLRQAIVNLAGNAAALRGNGFFLGAARLFSRDILHGQDAAPQVARGGGGSAQAQGELASIAAAAACLEGDRLSGGQARAAGFKRLGGFVGNGSRLEFASG